MKGYSTVIEKLISSTPSPNTDGAYAEVRRGAAEEERTYSLSVANPALSEYVDLYIDKKNGEHPVVRYQNLNSAGETQTRFLELYNGTTNKQKLIDLMHPVGSYLTMSTNTNPSTKLGGTWTLVNKQYSVISSNSENVNFLNQNTKNVTTTKNFMFRNGNTIVLEFRFTPKDTITLQDDAIVLGTLNTDALGITTFGATRYFLLAGDSAEGIAHCKLDYTTNEISILDTVGTQGKTGLTAGYLLSGQLVTVVKPEYMLDNACNQFIFKRTA